ncbi:MAG: AmmeMemoRadiSam system protein A [Chloroflexi bacterium]|jgi:AmmeMemoRadiSam system protein A|nr:AmmeMemoRadiSam system protein A [Chloroflexota bacterium]
MPAKLSLNEQAQLLTIARDAVNATARNQPLTRLDPEKYSHVLTANGASFVTLTISGILRGCIGTLEAYQPLIVDVQKRALQAASQDPRFHPVTPEELAQIKIEVSRLSAPEPVDYDHPQELLTLLIPGEDGVIISEGHRRATFLPQVWEDLPDTKQFLSQLCRKMGCSPDFWEQKKLDVARYHVEEFSE